MAAVSTSQGVWMTTAFTTSIASKIGNNNDSRYFTDKDRGTGGLAFALWNADVSRFLFDNAISYLRQFHADGFRYDEISALLSTGQGSGWEFCRALTTKLRDFNDRILQNAEFWPGEFPDIPSTSLRVISSASTGGLGFDVVQHDYLRSAVRDAVQAASRGANATVSVSGIAAALYPPTFDHAWRAVTCVENHDLVLAGRDPRIPMLADPSNRRSWYARSRSRLATGLLLTAPGIPQLFMGQEFLEDKPWDVLPNGPNLLWWDGLNADQAMSDHLRFTRELIHLRGSLPALRGVTTSMHSIGRTVIACSPFTVGLRAVDRMSLSLPHSQKRLGTNYNIGFPVEGFWAELFNSDVYDHWVNPWAAGNGRGVSAEAGPLHGFAASGAIVIPANSILIFAQR
jgi:1,4-alpha-glucan branching enzyme